MQVEKNTSPQLAPVLPSLMRNATFMSLFFQNLLFFSSQNILNVVPDHLAILGASKVYIGLFMNINSLALVLLVIPLSRYTDRVGRKRLLVLGSVAAFAALLLSFVFAENLVLLMVFKVAATLVFCAGFTIYGAEAFEIIPKERRMAGMGIFGISGLISNPISSLCGEQILHHLGAPWLFVGAAIFMGLGFLLTLSFRFHRPDKPVEKGAFFRLLGRPEIRTMLILILIMGGAFSIFATFLANFTRERLGVVNISLFFTSFSVVAILTRLFLGWRLERVPKMLLVALAFGFETMAFVLSLFLHEAWLLIPIGVFYGLGHSILFPLMSALMVNSGGDDEKLGLNNIFLSVNTLGNIALALALGSLADFLGLSTVYGVMGAITLAGAVLALVSLQRNGRQRSL